MNKMRNIPDFTCEYGAALLVLEDIPYGQTAYVLPHWVSPGKAAGFLEECRRFCRMAGAERVLVQEEALGQAAHGLGLRTELRILAMQGETDRLPHGDAHLFPVTEATWGDFLAAYNGAMSGVDGARRLYDRDQEALLKAGGCYFVHRDGTALGLGIVEGDCLLALASLRPGMGETVVATLAEASFSSVVRLFVAEHNERALRLYRRLGFVTTGVKETWLRVERSMEKAEEP